MRLRPSFSSLISASFVAGLAAFGAAEMLRAFATNRLSLAPGVLDRLHATSATLFAPLGAACLGAVWILLATRLEAELADRAVLSMRKRAALLALVSILTIGIPAYGVAWAVSSGTTAWKPGTAYKLALGVTCLSPLARYALHGLGRLLERAVLWGKHTAALVLSAVTALALLAWVFGTRGLGDRYGVTQLVSYLLVPVGITLLWSPFFGAFPAGRSARIGLCIALGVSLVALVLPPSLPALELFYVERPTSVLGRALAGLQRDSDGDGAPGSLGFLRGGDCDDGDARRHPLAIDVPGNGIDDNCFGGDRTLARAAAERSIAGATAKVEAGFEPRSVVVVAIDSMRFDRRFASGLDPGVTPALARLAAQSLTFADFRTCSPRTRESVPDLLGETRRGTRAYDTGGVIAALAGAGMHTAFIASDWLERYARIEGFAERHHPAARYGHFADDAVSARALDFLEHAPKGPFFLFVHFLGAHEPYDPAPACASSSDYARYRCALTALDRRVDALYQTLARTGRLASTVFVVSADHGEEFGEHGGRYHATTLYDEVLRVPLVVAAPDIEPKLVNEPLGCFDFLPTVLARAGIELESDWLGCDRLSAGDGSRCGQQARTRGTSEQSRFEPHQHAVVAGGHKLVFDRATGLQRTFDLRVDPDEKRPLARAPGPLAAELSERMDTWLSAQAAGDRPSVAARPARVGARSLALSRSRPSEPSGP